MQQKNAGDPSMDQQAFDRLTRLFSQSRSRRESIGALLGVAIAGFAEHTAGAKSGGKPHGRRGNGDRNRGRGKGDAVLREQTPASCYPGSSCAPGKGKNNSKCDFSDSTIFK